MYLYLKLIHICIYLFIVFYILREYSMQKCGIFSVLKGAQLLNLIFLEVRNYRFVTKRTKRETLIVNSIQTPRKSLVTAIH